MEVTYYGADCIEISLKQLNLVINPQIDKFGLKLPKLKTDIALFTSLPSEPLPSGFVIAQPGEYELKNVAIKGIAANLHSDPPEESPQNVMYTISTAGITLLFTGNIKPDLSEQQAEAIGTVNVLVLPVGGFGLSMDASSAAKFVGTLEPQFIIPIFYDDGATKYPVPQAKIDTFLSEVGQKPEPIDKLKITAKDLETEAKVVVLKRQSS